MIAVRISLLPVFAATLLGGRAAAQQAVTPLAIEDAVGMTELRGQGEFGAISPDGALLAYIACDARRQQGDSTAGGAATVGSAYRSLGCDVRVTALADGSTRTIASSTRGGHWAPSWSPDGRRLAFYSDRAGVAQVWLWERASNRLRRAAAAEVYTPGGLAQPLWTPDGKALVVELLARGVSRSELIAKARQLPHPAPPPDVVPDATLTLYRSAPPSRATSATSPSADASVANYNDFGLIDVASGRVRRINERTSAAWARLSPDGRWLAYLSLTAYAGGKEQTARFALRLVELATSRERTLATDIRQGPQGAITWSPNSKHLAYVSVQESTEDEQHGDSIMTSPVGSQADGDADLYVVTVEGGPPRRFTGPPDALLTSVIVGPLWNSTSDELVAAGQRKLWRASLASGTLTEVPTSVPVHEIVRAGDQRTYWSPDGGTSLYVLTSDSTTLKGGYATVNLRTGAARHVVQDQRRFGRYWDAPLVTPHGDAVAYLGESASEPPDLWVAGIDFAAPRRLTTLNPRLARYTFGKARLIDYLSHDGTPLRGTLVLPAGYEPGRRYPLVVWVYASEMGSRNLNRFGLSGIAAYNLQMLATRGYAVLSPDIPVHVGTPMRDLMKSVMPAIDKVVELGIADPERLAVAGQSNGGYSTLALLVQTTRFKAAVMNAGFGDLTGLYGAMQQMAGTSYWQSWLEQNGGAMGAPPWAVPLSYVENSPVFYLERVQTPLLIQAGSADARIVSYSDQVFVGLKRLQRDVTYLRYGGEGHVLEQHPNLVDYWQRVLAFFDAKLKGHPTGGATKASRSKVGSI